MFYYNKQKELTTEIVQKMINPEFAGVSFSIDPTSRSKNYTAIEICEGVGVCRRQSALSLVTYGA